MSHTFTQSTLPSTQTPETLATYRWLPPSPAAIVFLVHGFRTHSFFNFLRHDTPDPLNSDYGEGTCAQDTSIIRELNQRNIGVLAHDHIGHGRSTGLRAYFPSFSVLVADLMSHVRHADVDLSITKRNIPMFLIGHSLGGTIAIIAARDDPALFKGIALSSPATEPPANMFGVMGRIQRALSGITSILIPKVEIIALPKAPDPKLQAFYDADPLNSSTGVRARVGKEVLNAYKNIGDHAADVKLPFLIVHGENDNLISPQAAPRFHDAASSEDKTIFLGKGRGHNLLSEEGKEEMWELFADWIAHRIK